MTKITTLFVPEKAYTVYMVFAKVTEAPKPRTKVSQYVARLFGILLLGMAVTQLFSFEKFIPIIETYQLPGGHATAVMIASIIVICEVFALPFILRMKISPLMRIASMICGVLVAGVWLGLIFWTVFADTTVQFTGFFGTRIVISLTGYSVIYPMLLLLLAGWSIWGLGPRRNTHMHSKARL